jgi:hypothetical protein
MSSAFRCSWVGPVIALGAKDLDAGLDQTLAPLAAPLGQRHAAVAARAAVGDIVVFA